MSFQESFRAIFVRFFGPILKSIEFPSCSTEHTYYTMSCNGPHVPQEYLFKSPDQKVATLVTNNYLSNLLAQKHLPKISNFDVDIASGRFKVGLVRWLSTRVKL